MLVLVDLGDGMIGEKDMEVRRMVAWVVKQHADGLLWMDNELLISCPGGWSCDARLDLLLSSDEWQARCDRAGVICKSVCWTERARHNRINEKNKRCRAERGTLRNTSRWRARGRKRVAHLDVLCTVSNKV